MNGSREPGARSSLPAFPRLPLRRQGRRGSLRSRRPVCAHLRQRDRPGDEQVDAGRHQGTQPTSGRPDQAEPLRRHPLFGHGKKRLIVFSDPDCPYCKTLQPEVDKLHDIEVWVFPYPLTGLHSGGARRGYRDLVSARPCCCLGTTTWCAMSLRRQARPAPIRSRRNLALATSLGIRATPTIVLPDGSVIEGGAQAERIEAQVAEASK